jgi:hypothetical protein
LIQDAQAGFELYDNRTDPGFERDRWTLETEAASEGARLLDRLVPEESAPLSGEHRLDPETARRLRALGYLPESPEPAAAVPEASPQR